MPKPLPLEHYLDAYARSYYRVQTCSPSSVVLAEANAARRRLLDHIKSYGYRGPNPPHNQGGV